jgi:hypothetical protein
VEYRNTNGQGYGPCNNAVRDKDCDTPNDKTGAGGSLKSTPRATERNLVRRHTIIESEVKTWEYMCECLHSGEIYPSDTDDISERCREVTSGFYR